MLLETDCPYCEIRNSHYGASLVKSKFPKVNPKKHDGSKLVKNRNEPCTIVQIVEVVAALKGIDEEELCEVTWQNSVDLLRV